MYNLAHVRNKLPVVHDSCSTYLLCVNIDVMKCNVNQTDRAHQQNGSLRQACGNLREFADVDETLQKGTGFERGLCVGSRFTSGSGGLSDKICGHELCNALGAPVCRPMVRRVIHVWRLAIALARTAAAHAVTMARARTRVLKLEAYPRSPYI
jgi:hypothetical protein